MLLVDGAEERPTHSESLEVLQKLGFKVDRGRELLDGSGALLDFRQKAVS